MTTCSTRDPHNTWTTIPLRLPTQTAVAVHGISIRQAAPERGSVSPPSIIVRGHRWPRVPWVHLLLDNPLLCHPLPNPNNSQQATPREAHTFGGTLSTRRRRVEIVSAASDMDMDPTRYVTSCSAAERQTSHCRHARKMPLLGLRPSMAIRFLCKTGADWIDFRRRVANVRSIDVVCHEKTFTNYWMQ